MQRIERYGVIFLVLLLVTITAVSFWDDGELALEGERTPGRERLAQRVLSGAEADPSGGRIAGSPTPGRDLPLTRAKKVPTRRSNQAPHRPQGAPRGAKSQNSPFATLPATVASEPQPRSQPRQLGFPELGRPGTAGRAGEAQESPPKRPAKHLATTNYDSISERRGLLEASSQSPRRPPSPREAHPSPREAQESLARSGTYTVEPGDTLSQIAYRTLGTSKRWREIQALNGNLDPATLSVGTVLRIPVGEAPESPPTLLAPSVTGRVPQAEDGFYIVRKGDMLSGIALEKLGGASRWREILALNPAIDPDRLQEGARLRLPDANVPALRISVKAPAGGRSRSRNRVR